MSEEQKKILEMLASGKITVNEAEQLLSALSLGREDATAAQASDKTKPKPKYLIVNVLDENNGETPKRVNVRVPLQMLRAGVRLASVIPAVAKGHINEALNQQGIQLDLENLRPEDLQELVEAMSELTVDVNEGRQKVRVYCE